MSCDSCRIDNYSCSTVFILEINSYTRHKYGKKASYSQFTQRYW